MNPFSNDINKDYLFSFSTGKATSVETANYLINVKNSGDAARDAFIQQCCEKPNRFRESIKRQKVLTFATESAYNKLVDVVMTRDLFGSILFHALEKKVDMEGILKYPLTPVPLSLSHADRTMQKTVKVKLLN